MEVGIANITDEMLIGELLEKWATATRFGSNYEAPANHASDVTIFEVRPRSSMKQQTLTEEAGTSRRQPQKDIGFERHRALKTTPAGQHHSR